jgi:putative addiction module component (TIGR02574 family)
MSVKVNDLLRQALELEPKAREELATLLLESLPTESPMEVEAAWEATIRRRVHELESGAVQTIPWEELREQLVRGEGGS